MSKAEDSLEKLYNTEDNDLSIQHIEYDPTGQPNSQNAINRAAVENLNVVFPTSHELFIDIDNELSYQMFLRQFQVFQKFVDGDAEFVESPSKSGLPKRHVAVWLSRPIKDEVERILFQALLGSDRVREILGYVQAVNGDPHPTLFLEAKPKLLTGAVFEDGDILTDDDIPF